MWYAGDKAKKSAVSDKTSLQPSIESSTKPPAVAPIAQAVYNCDGGKTVNAAFYKGEVKEVQPGEPPIPTGIAKIILSDGRNFNLAQTISADGGRYANGDESFVFWSKGDAAIILENNIEKDYVGCSVAGSEVNEEAIEVISPNGGEAWAMGQSVKISWRASESVKTVNIRLSILGQGDGQSFNAAIASGVPNTGEYAWTVQNLYAEAMGITDLPASEKYLVTVEDSDRNNIYDTSNAVFSIKAAHK